jgi:predicted O-methyltransferase YrrM
MNHSSPISYALRHPGKAAWKLVRIIGGKVAKAQTVAQSKLPEGLEPLFLLNEQRKFNATCENMYLYGGSLQRQRIENIARWSAAHYAGDFVEIGALAGETSRILAKAAAETGRRLIVIDPWMTGSQDCQGSEYEQFLANIAPWREHVDVWRESSVNAEIIAKLKARPLCFAFVDGWHVLHACFSDLMAAGHAAGIIATDDVRYNHDLAFAHQHAGSLLGRDVIIDPDMREAYLLPPKKSK